MGRKKRRRTDNVIQFPKDHNIAEEMLKRVIDLFDMQVYLNKWAKSMLQYQSEDDPNIKQTYEEYIAELDVDGTPFVDGMTEVEMRREYRDHIEGNKSFLTKIADNTSISDADLEYIRTLLAHEFGFGVFDHSKYTERMLGHYGKFVLSLFPDYPMEEFGGLKAFQEQYELIEEYEGNLDEFVSKERAEFDIWLKETAPKKKSNNRILGDDVSEQDLSSSDSE